MKQLAYALSITIGLLSASANAACNNPEGVEGEIIYNRQWKTMQFCDNTLWRGMGGSNGGAAVGALGQVQFAGSDAAFLSDPRLHWDNTNKRLGIGTSTPGVRLEVLAGQIGQTAPVEAIRIMGPNTPTNSNSAQDLKWKFAGAGSAGIRGARGASWDTHLHFLTNAYSQNADAPSIRMTITSEGQIGIGTISPASILHVSSTGQIYPRIESTNNHAGLDIYAAANMAAHIRYYENGTYRGTTGYDHTNDAMKLVYAGSIYSANGLTVRSNGFVGVGVVAPTHLLHVNGIARSTQANFATSSDARAKHNIQPLTDSLNTITRLNPVSFEYTPEYQNGNAALSGTKRGFIAQDVESVLPDMVRKIEEKIGDQTLNDFRVLENSDFVPLLISAVKELKAQNEVLLKRLEALENEKTP